MSYPSEKYIKAVVALTPEKLGCTCDREMGGCAHDETIDAVVKAIRQVDQPNWTWESRGTDNA